MAPSDRCVRFNGWTFDPDTGELIRQGAPVARLQEQPSRILEALASRAGRLVTRDELQKLLWPEHSLVDADNGLNIAINKIRLALEDSSTRPQFIQTVPRRGYRFIGEIEPGPVPSAVARQGDRESHAIHPQVQGDAALPGWSAHRVRAAGVAGVGLLALSLIVVVTAWRTPGRPAAIRSAAVVPFANLAGDPALDYAVEGLTDTIATELSVRGVYRVISMQASAHYRNASASPQRIASELHADAVVLGSVVRDGASFVVNVRLVDGRTERPLWAKRFVRATTTELTFSDDVVTGLATALALEPQPARPTRRAEVAMARDEYLRGRHFWNMRTAQGMDASVQHLTRAIEIDRGYALAWAGLADVYAAGGDAPSALFAPWPGPVEAGLRAAEEALRLDASLGEAHAALGRFRMMQWRWKDAERELSEAVRLSPNYAPARQWYGTLLLRLRKCPAAIEQTAVGAEIDPITPIINEAVGTTLSACGQPERAILAFQKVLEMHPAFASTHMRLAGAYLRRGDAASALSEYREAVRLRPNNCEFQARMTGALRALGNVDEARTIGTRVLGEAAAGRASQYCAALVYANLGDVDGAFAALEAEVAAHGRADSVLGDFHLRTLHSDPRWPRLLDRVGLTPYARSAR